SLAPEIVVQGTGPGWFQSPEDFRLEPGSESASIQFAQEESDKTARPFTLTALALEAVSLPAVVVPRLLIKTRLASDGTRRSLARYWVENHGSDFSFALPDDARWIGARVDGRIAAQIDRDPNKGEYRLRFPGEVGSRPVLVELEFQGNDQNAAVPMGAP